MKKNRLILITLLVSINAMAEGIWGDWVAQGNDCSRNTVQVLTSGDTLSVLMTELGIKMRRGNPADHLEKHRNCNFRIIIDPPPGHYVASFQQLFLGGVIKSSQTAGDLQIRFHVGPTMIGELPPLVWRRGQVITPADPESVFAKSLESSSGRRVCKEKISYAFGINFRGYRNNIQEHFISAIDSLDSSLKMRIRPIFKPCQ